MLRSGQDQEQEVILLYIKLELEVEGEASRVRSLISYILFISLTFEICNVQHYINLHAHSIWCKGLENPENEYSVNLLTRVLSFSCLSS